MVWTLISHRRYIELWRRVLEHPRNTRRSEEAPCLSVFLWLIQWPQLRLLELTLSFRLRTVTLTLEQQLRLRNRLSSE